LRVLVVDDDEDTRALLCMGLERLGLQAFEAAGVAEARRALAAGPVDVILTDWHLGDGTSARLIEEAGGRGVVLLTGDDQALSRRWPPSVRAIKKPASLEELVAAIRMSQPS
jgi:DNA-binding response OmpR family regulator